MWFLFKIAALCIVMILIGKAAVWGFIIYSIGTVMCWLNSFYADRADKKCRFKIKHIMLPTCSICGGPTYLYRYERCKIKRENLHLPFTSARRLEGGRIYNSYEIKCDNCWQTDYQYDSEEELRQHWGYELNCVGTRLF